MLAVRPPALEQSSTRVGVTVVREPEAVFKGLVLWLLTPGFSRISSRLNESTYGLL